jgi:hypothetical protein
MRLKRYTEYLKESINLNGLTENDIKLMLEELTLDTETFPEELEISLTQGKTARPTNQNGEMIFSFSFVPRIEVKIKVMNPPRTFRSYGDDVRRFLLSLMKESRFTEVINNFSERLDYYDLTVEQPVVPHNLDYILVVIRTKNEE